MVAAAWMGLAVKTDGAAVASGAVAESLIRAQALQTMGIACQPNWIVGTATTGKVFIDVFIGGGRFFSLSSGAPESKKRTAQV